MIRNKTNTMVALVALMAGACGGGGSGTRSLGGLTDSGYLAEIDSATGGVTLVSEQGVTGFSELHSIARDPSTGTVYGIGEASTTSATVLVRIDPTSGPHGLENPPRVIAEVDGQAPSNLAWHAGEETLIQHIFNDFQKYYQNQ